MSDIEQRVHRLEKWNRRLLAGLLAVFALMSPTFAGEKSARLRFAGIWAGLIVISHWLITGGWQFPHAPSPAKGSAHAYSG